MHEVILTEQEAGLRLDRYLRKLLVSVPLGAIFRHLRNGAIQVNGMKVAGDLRLLPGMRLQLHLSPADLAAMQGKGDGKPPAPAGEPVRTTLPLAEQPRIVRQDEHILVVSKPAGLAVHGGSGIKHSVVDWLSAQPLGVRTGTWRPAPAHRLDRGTTGLLLIGLVPAALRKLTAAFRDGAVKKLYHAVVHGVPAERQGSITVPLRVVADADADEPKVEADSRGQPARTDWDVARTARYMTLLRVVPHAGRQHQIRAHLAHIGHPIVGDQRYGSAADMGRGFLLHASELDFPHPHTGKLVQVSEPLPPRFLQLFEAE